MMDDHGHARNRAEALFKPKEKAREKRPKAPEEYEANLRALREKTARLSPAAGT
jgi:hypothetical protein